MTPKMLPYRITIELADGRVGKTLQVTGETPDVRGGDGGLTHRECCTVAANALLCQSELLAQGAAQMDETALQDWAALMSMPVTGSTH